MSHAVPVARARINALDGLRGVAIIMVLMSHIWTITDIMKRHDWMKVPFSSGNAAVSMFFVVSGYLAVRSMLQQVEAGRFHPGVSFVRRWIRISSQVYPLVVLVLVLTAIDANMNTYQTSNTRDSAFSIFTYLWSSYVRENATVARPDLGHLWYVCTDVWVGGFLLILVLILGRYRLPLLLSLLGLSFLVYAFRHHIFLTEGEGSALIRIQTRADGLFWGGIAAVVQPWASRWRAHLQPAGWVSALSLVPLVYLVNGEGYFGPWGVVLNLGLAILVLTITEGALSRPISAALSFDPLVRIGHYAFGLYVWHYPIFWYISRNYLDWSQTQKVVVGLAVTWGLAFLARALLERPVQRWMASDAWRPVDDGIPRWLLRTIKAKTQGVREALPSRTAAQRGDNETDEAAILEADVLNEPKADTEPKSS